MKNLFVITEDEKNRILGLHETATKNQYLISEQTLSDYPINNIQTVVIGSSNNDDKHTIIDGTTSNNIILGFERETSESPQGRWYVQNQKYYNEYHGGNWTFDNNTRKYTFSSDDGTLNKSGDFAQWGAFDDLVRFVVNKYQNSESMGDKEFSAALAKLAQDRNIQIKKDSLLAQYNVKAKYNIPQDQGEVLTKPEDMEASVRAHAQYCGWGNDIQGFMDSGKKCPKPGSVIGGGENQTPPKPKYYKEIIDLQTKVGQKSTGALDQSTLKAIMDKLSQ